MTEAPNPQTVVASIPDPHAVRDLLAAHSTRPRSSGPCCASPNASNAWVTGTAMRGVRAVGSNNDCPCLHPDAQHDTMHAGGLADGLALGGVDLGLLVERLADVVADRLVKK